MTAVLVAPSRFSDLPALTRQLVIECAGYGPTLLATPFPGDALRGAVDEVPVSLHRPLELQPGCDWLADVDDPILVALDTRVEPVAISRRYPVAWLEAGSLPTPNSAAIALTTRSSLVVAPAAVRRALAIHPERFLDIHDLTGSKLWKALHGVSQASPSDALHALLSAELFHRDAEAQRRLDVLNGIGVYRRTRIAQGLGVVRAEEIASICDEAGDNVGAAIASILEPSSRHTPIPDVEAPPFIALMIELEAIADLPRLLAHPAVRNYERQKPWTRHLILRRVLRLVVRSDPPSEGQASQLGRLLAYPDALHLIGADVVAWLGATGPDVAAWLATAAWATPHLLERLRESTEPYTALSAKLELWRRHHTQGGWVDERALEEALAAVDSRSWHEGLWRSALDYWRRMTGTDWLLETDKPAPPPPRGVANGLPSSDVGELDRQAREALANEDWDRAIELFSWVRSLCLAEDPPLVTTEMAARLNLGWALWKAGRPQTEWRTYLSSVLEAVRPDPELVRLRQRTVDLLRTVNSDEDRDTRYARELGARLAAIEALPPGEMTTLRTEVEKVIEEIDAGAVHQGLWVTGLKYWRRITGSAWCLRPSDPAPPAPPHEGESLDPGAIAELDRSAKRALARGWKRRAAKLFLRVRSACEALDPPLRSTERAARLNLGWTYWKLGRPEGTWRPFLTSVLEEVRPAEPFVEVRERAAQLLNRKEHGA